MEKLPSWKCVNEDGAGCFPAGSGKVDLHGVIDGPCGWDVSEIERAREGFAGAPAGLGGPGAESVGSVAVEVELLDEGVAGGAGVVFSGMVLVVDGLMRRLGLRRLGQVVPATFCGFLEKQGIRNESRGSGDEWWGENNEIRPIRNELPVSRNGKCGFCNERRVRCNEAARENNELEGDDNAERAPDNESGASRNGGEGSCNEMGDCCNGRRRGVSV